MSLLLLLRPESTTQSLTRTTTDTVAVADGATASRIVSGARTASEPALVVSDLFSTIMPPGRSLLLSLRLLELQQSARTLSHAIEKRSLLPGVAPII